MNAPRAPRKFPVRATMSEDDPIFRDGPDGGGSERAWDEYDWERFLQQQDQKTERYMELLERYFEHPDRDQIIAREMGWHHLLDEDGRDWGEDVDALFAREATAGGPDDGEETDVEDDEPTLPRRDPAEPHPLYRQAQALAASVDFFFTARDKRTGELPAPAARLAANATLASVKLAAALSDDDIDELGMTIAYLKRGLKAVTNALDATAECEEQRLLEPERAAFLRAGIFGVRDGIITLMGELRGQWRQRHGRGRD